MSDQLKQSIRPTINTIDASKDSLEIECFQNKTLRPILKLQNDLIIACIQNYLISKKIDLKKETNPAIKLTEVIKKDSTLKLELRTMVIAHFTTTEYKTYLSEQKAYNKRISTMMIERIINQFQF